MPTLRNRWRTRCLSLSLGVCTGLLSLSGAPVAALSETDDATDLAELVVIVNGAAGIETMSGREIRKLFLGKSRKLPDGSRAVLASFEPARSSFNRRALARSDSQVDAAWARLRFSGRIPPPRAFGSVDAVIDFVASTPHAIAFLPAGAELAGVRTVFVLPER